MQGQTEKELGAPVGEPEQWYATKGHTGKTYPMGPVRRTWELPDLSRKAATYLPGKVTGSEGERRDLLSSAGSAASDLLGTRVPNITALHTSSLCP